MTVGIIPTLELLSAGKANWKPLDLLLPGKRVNQECYVYILEGVCV